MTAASGLCRRDLKDFDKQLNVRRTAVESKSNHCYNHSIKRLPHKVSKVCKVIPFEVVWDGKQICRATSQNKTFHCTRNLQFSSVALKLTYSVGQTTISIATPGALDSASNVDSMRLTKCCYYYFFLFNFCYTLGSKDPEG